MRLISLRRLSLYAGLLLAACAQALADAPSRLSLAHIDYAEGTATRADVLATRVFAREIVVAGAGSATEDSDMGESLRAYALAERPTDYSALEQFLTDHPGSVYEPFLRVQLARGYYQQGRYSRALSAYSSAWTRLREIPPDLSPVADLSGEVVAGYARMLSRVGRQAELESLLGEADTGRAWVGSSREQIDQARVGLWLMHNRPGRSFRCGALALASLAAEASSPAAASTVFTESVSPPEGFSLADLEAMSAQADWPHQAIHVGADAPIPVPAVVHWNIGHYAAILARRGDSYLVRDPTFGENRDMVIGAAALREEASGFFLVEASVALEDGWRAATETEKSTTRGRGQTYGNNPAATRAGDNTSPPCSGGAGMAVAAVKSMLVSLHLRDTPLFYQPPYGPGVDFEIHYNQRENNAFFGTFANFGPRWSFGWIGWINEEGGGLPPSGPNDYPVPFTLAAPLGGEISYAPLSQSPGPATPPEYFRGDYDGSRAVRLAPGSYVITYPDGSSREFAHPVGIGSERPVLLTRVVDPTGQAVTINYDSNHRITTIVDAANAATAFQYHATLPNRIIRLTLPDGRWASFDYTTDGRLREIRDAQGIVSTFDYESAPYSDRINALHTPYGETRFRFGETASFDDPTRYRWIETTDPLGNRQRVEFNERDDAGIPDFEPWNEGRLPNMPIRNVRLNTRNTFVWSKKAFSLAPTLAATTPDQPANTPALGSADYGTAEVLHWLHKADLAEDTLESVKRPGEGRVWFNYKGQYLPSEAVAVIGPQPPGLITDDEDYSDPFRQLAYPVYSDRATELGSPAVRLPSRIGRMVPDPTGALDGGGNPVLVSRIESLDYNTQGRLVRYRDPEGREMRYHYAANGLDMEYAERLVARVPGNDNPDSWTWEKLLQVDWNSGVAHRPHSITDQARQTTTFTYNSAGQPRTVTNALNEVTTYWYHPTGQGVTPTTSLSPTAVGFLVRVDGPLSGTTDTVHLTWDSSGRVRTRTDVDGHTLTFDYDNLDRVTRVTYPDTTYEEFDFGDKLDLEVARDRSGRTTLYDYDALGRLRHATDPAENTSEWSWCGCGSLERFIDARGNATRYEYDVNGRLTHVHREGGAPSVTTATFQYSYDVAGRLSRRTDPRSQVTNYRYTRADELAAIVHTNAVEPTPDTFYERDPMRARLIAVENKLSGTSVGRIDYVYRPITASPGTLGAGEIDTVSGPLADSTITHGYDALGRLTGRSMTGQAESWAFDALGRLSTVTNPLGTFTPGYAGASGRVTSLSRTSGLTVNLAYDPLNSDLGLAQVETRRADASLAADITYANDHLKGLPTSAQETINGGSPSTWNYTYTALDELETAHSTGAAVSGLLPDYTFVYDPAGNRIGAQAASDVGKWTADGHNRYTTRESGGWASFRVHFPVPPLGGKADINGQAAPLNAAGDAQRIVPVVAGTNHVTVRAVVPGENAVLKRTIDFTAYDNPALTYEYDANGNLTKIKEGASELIFYRYDARDRLVAWGVGSSVSGRFVYDPLGRLSRETDSGGASRRSWLWAGDELAQTRNSNNTVATRLFAQGERRETGANPGNRYYARDAQGSVRVVLNAANATVAAYSYDPYGKRVQTAGTETHDLGYQGAYHHGSTDLILSSSGAYDPQLGRWQSPASDADSTYAFAANAPPTAGRGHLGMIASGAHPPTSDEEWLDAAGLAQGIGSFAAGVIAERLIKGERERRGESGGTCAVGSGTPPKATESGGLRTFYSVQGEADAARLAAGGAPWPTGLQRANLGEGLYAWGTRAEAEAYAAGKQGASILEFKMPSGDYSGLKTLDMRLMSDEAATNWLGQYSQYGQGMPHGFEHIIRQTGRGTEFYFSPTAFGKF